MRRYTVSIDDRSFTIDVVETAADRFEVSVDGRVFEATLHGDHDLPGSVISPEISVPTGLGRPATTAARAPAPLPAPVPATRDASRLADTLSAPMPGIVLEVFVTPGATLARGDPVLVLEAMKMRNTIRSPRDALVVEVAVAAGQPVGPGDLLVRLGDAAR